MTERAGRLRETLAVLDVGHGASAVLFSGNDVAVFDTGTGSSLLEFLDQQGVTRIRTVVLSHADFDHIGGLVGLLAANTVAIGRVVVNTDSSQGSAAWDDLLYELDARRRAGTIVFDIAIRAGDSEIFGNVTAAAVAPSSYLAAKGPGSKGSIRQKDHQQLDQRGDPHRRRGQPDRGADRRPRRGRPGGTGADRRGDRRADSGVPAPRGWNRDQRRRRFRRTAGRARAAAGRHLLHRPRAGGDA